MRFVILAAIVGLAGCSAQGQTPVAAAPEYAIPNPQRPGAKAPDCKTLIETTDGCVFHTNKDDVNPAKLPASAGSVWVAHPSEQGIVTIREAANDSSGHQVIEIVPTTPKDADITVTLDRLIGQPGAQKVVERRRVTVMIHAS